MTSAFAAAAQSVAQDSPAGASSDAGNLAESFAGETSQLFGQTSRPSSLLNKTHPMGTSRSGKITAAPYDVHSVDFTTKKPKYWAASPLPDGKKVTTEPLDHITREKLRPVKDTGIELATEYRFDAAEAGASNRDPNLPDDGARAFYASGDDLKQLRAEIRRLGFRSEQEMIGATLTVQRVGQRPNPNGNPSWINKVTLSR